MHRLESGIMRNSIIIGGLVGIVLGAIATFVLAHGLLLEPAAGSDPEQPAVRAPTVSRDLERQPGALPVAPHRPVRPGSARVAGAQS